MTEVVKWRERNQSGYTLDSMGAKIEEALRVAGNFGRWHWAVLLLASIPGLLLSHRQGLVFVGGIPDHWCHVEELTEAGWTSNEIKKVAIPSRMELGAKIYDRCNMYQRNYTELLHSEMNNVELDDAPIISCQEWDYDNSTFRNTIVTEWKLYCDRLHILSTVQSLYVFGILVGSIFIGPLSDRFGRRRCAIVATVFMMISTVGTMFTFHYIMLGIMWFFLGWMTYSMYCCCFSLVAELCPDDKRTLVVYVFDQMTAVGRLAACLLAYLFRDWRSLLIALGLPTLSGGILYWVLPESPRWLLVRGRRAEAAEILMKGAKWNRIELPNSTTLKNIFDATKEEVELTQKSGACCTINLTCASAIRTREMRRRSIPIYFCWFALAFVSYGMTFHFAKLPFNIYVTYGINAGAIAITKFAIIFYPIPDKIGRRSSFLACFLIGGASGLLILAVPKELEWLSIVLSLICSSFIDMTFTLVYLYTAELFPTEVRTASIATGSVFARIGGILSPYMSHSLSAFHYAIPSAVFGGMACFAAVACCFLPETKGKNLPETVAELERTNRKKEEGHTEDTSL